MNNSENLSKVASIRTGYTFRGKVVPSENGNIQVLQPKDINGDVLAARPTLINEENISGLETHLLKPGDILIPNKGSKAIPYLYTGSELSIASASFFVVSPYPHLVISEYLMWFFFQPISADYLSRILTGTTVPSMTKKDLERLPVIVPSLEIQSQIEKKIHAVRIERVRIQELIQKRQAFLDSLSWELINAK